MNDFFKRLEVNHAAVNAAGFNPYYHQIKSALDDPIILETSQFINLAANNYLGIANDERIKNAMKSSIDQYGTSMCGTPVATGCVQLMEQAENVLKDFLGLPAIQLYPSGYQANAAIFKAFVRKEDLLLCDHFIHASLIDGLRASYGKIMPFLHNDPIHLEKLLQKRTSYDQVFIVTEGVFSTDGSLAPVKGMVDLCRKYNAILVIDDSHGIGVTGSIGKGVTADIPPDILFIYTASLGKALALSGGIVGGPKQLIEFLNYYCSGLVYSTALVPAILGAIPTVIDILKNEHEKRYKTSLDYVRQISEALINKNISISNSQSLIVSICSGCALDTIKLAKHFFDKKILTTPFIEPSVPPNKGKVRLIPGANLKPESIQKVIKVINSIEMT